MAEIERAGMSEEIKLPPVDVNEPQEKVIFQVILNREGQMKIAGILLVDEINALGVLEKCKQMISDGHKPKIVQPTGGIMRFIKNGKR